MNMSKLRALIIAFFGMVALLAPQAQAETQAWPQRPVKFWCRSVPAPASISARGCSRIG